MQECYGRSPGDAIFANCVSFASDRASRQQMLDLAQAALSMGIERAGRCDGCLDHVGESATCRCTRRQQLRQRLNCGAFVHGQNRPLLAHSSLEINWRDLRVRQKQLAQAIEGALLDAMLGLPIKTNTRAAASSA